MPALQPPIIGVISYVYELPTLKERNAILRTAIGGWQATGIVRATSGAPFTVLAGADRSQTGLSTDRAFFQFSLNPYSSAGCVAQPCRGYLNQAAFSLPPIGSAGNLGKDSLFGPHLTTWDFGLLKDIDLGSERYRLQFHAELFNVLNKDQLQQSRVDCQQYRVRNHQQLRRSAHRSACAEALLLTNRKGLML